MLQGVVVNTNSNVYDYEKQRQVFNIKYLRLMKKLYYMLSVHMHMKEKGTFAEDDDVPGHTVQTSGLSALGVQTPPLGPNTVPHQSQKLHPLSAKRLICQVMCLFVYI